MTRLAILAPLVAALCACSDRAPPPAPEPSATAAPVASKSEGRSVMRPAVIAEIKPAPPPVVTPKLPPAPVIGFERGIALDEAARGALDAMLANAVLPAGARFVLRGHSDSMGDDARNLIASRRRAEAVGAYLEKSGIAVDRIEVIALGERRPVAPNARPDGTDDPEGRARNRRVEVEIVTPPPATPVAEGEAAAGVEPAKPDIDGAPGR